MTTFTPTTKRNGACEVCGNESGKCRRHIENELHLCMTYGDARLGSIENGYKCIKANSGNGWASFKLDNSQEWSEQQRLEWKARNEQSKQKQAKENEQRQQRSLSVAERDRQYRQMLCELTLHPDDRADLIRRGFTGEQIELSGFKSIKRYQTLQSQFSELLPGISRGNRLIIRDEGYLCPVRNAEGLIVACQVRLRALPSGESNRYRWLSGNGQTLHLYPSGCKSEGELPLPVFRPQGKPEGIALAEGTGAKPFLVSQRLNLLAIGAAGGQWPSSPKLFRSTLEKAETEVQAKEIKIFPDAGDILNPSVMNRWQKVLTLLEEWEWSAQIGWWGQVDKSHPDIDELVDFSVVKYITPNEFLDLSGLKKTEESQRPEWKENARREWRKNRRFNADIKKASQWCDWEKPTPNSIFFGKAGLGRGKTTRLKSWVKEWRQEGVEGFVCLGYRNTLLLQLCEQLNFYHLHEHSGLQFKSASNEGIALCVDSLWRLNPDDFDDKIIIIDELKSVIKHLLHSPTVRNRDKILRLFNEAIQRSRQVICLDGLMADWCVDYVKSMAPDKQIITAENTYQSQKPIINFLLGTIESWEDKNGKKIKVNDRSPLFQHLFEEARTPAVCSDSQALIEALDNLFTEKGYKTLRVDSKTVPDKNVKEFLSDCNTYILKEKPDVLLYTPSAESGVDVSIKDYFTHHFGFFFGVIDIDGILQMLGRIRDNIPKFVWCKSFVSDNEKQHSNSHFSKTIEKAINELALSTIEVSITDEEGWREQVISHLTAVIRNSNTIDFRVSCLIKSIENHEKDNLRECLKEALLESGYTVHDHITSRSEDFGEKAKKATEEVKRQNAKDIFNAEKIDPTLVENLKFDARWEERCKVVQAKTRERLPGIEDTATWTEDFIYKIRYEDRQFLSKCEMFWLFKHPEVAKQLSQNRLHWMAKRLQTFIGDFRSQWLKIHTLHKIGFEKFLDPSAEWSNDSPEVIELLKLGKKHSNALGTHPGKLSPVQYLGRLLSLIGLSLESRKEGKMKRIYSLNGTVLNDQTRQQVLQCIENRLSQEQLPLDWEAAISEAHGIALQNEAKTQTEQTIQPPAPALLNVYKNGSGVSTENISESQSELALSENAQFCLQALAYLETPGHPTIYTHEQLIKLYFDVEAVGQGCNDELPSDFWVRLSTALGVVSESLEAHEIYEENQAQIQGEQVIQPPAPAPLNVYKNGSGVSSENQSELALIQPASSRMDFAGLVEQLRLAFDFKAFCRVVSGWAVDIVEDAISLQGTQPVRSQMKRWLELAATAQPVY